MYGLVAKDFKDENIQLKKLMSTRRIEERFWSQCPNCSGKVFQNRHLSTAVTAKVTIHFRTVLSTFSITFAYSLLRPQ
jgi:hypothetical protein